MILGVLGVAVSFAVITVIFPLVFKLLPDTKVAWRWVWTGAWFTGALFTLGKFLIGLYISKTGAGDAYGAGGAVVILLLWTCYSSIILLFGCAVHLRHIGRISHHIKRRYAAVRRYPWRITAKYRTRPRLTVMHHRPFQARHMGTPFPGFGEIPPHAHAGLKPEQPGSCATAIKARDRLSTSTTNDR